MDPMIDYGFTSDYVRMAVIVHLTALDYLGIDWDSEYGKRIQELQALALDAEPDMVIINDTAS